MNDILELTKERVISRLREEGLLGSPVTLEAKVLSPVEAIGNPEDYDFPLLKGRERIVEANYKDCLGHAFTDTYGGFYGPLEEVFAMEPVNNYRRALQVATVNALCRYWGLVENAVHCKDNQPKACAKKCAGHLHGQYPGISRIAMIGYQPAMVDALSKKFALKVVDLDGDNIGQERFGQTILDGAEYLEDAIEWAQVVFSTGTTVVNGTIDRIVELAGAKPVLFYGVTIAGAAAVLGLNRICFPK